MKNKNFSSNHWFAASLSAIVCKVKRKIFKKPKVKIKSLFNYRDYNRVNRVKKSILMFLILLVLKSKKLWIVFRSFRLYLFKQRDLWSAGVLCCVAITSCKKDINAYIPPPKNDIIFDSPEPVLTFVSTTMILQQCISSDS